MKHFLSRLLLFLLGLSFLFHIKPFYLLITEKYKLYVAGSEVYYSIKKSKQKKQSRILILGDSVGRQLFNNYNFSDSINSLASNQAIAMVGQFLLLNNYLETGNRPEKVYLIHTPLSFTANLNDQYTFNYFLKPFDNKNNRKYYTENVITQIEKIPLHFVAKTPYILTSNWSPDFVAEDSDNKFLSPIAIDYILKMKQLAKKYDFKFQIIPTPTKIKNKQKINSFNLSQISDNHFVNEFHDYFENILYLPESCFVDHVHLRNPEIYTNIYLKKFIK